jgi:hypothetical protein
LLRCLPYGPTKIGCIDWTIVAVRPSTEKNEHELRKCRHSGGRNELWLILWSGHNSQEANARATGLDEENLPDHYRRHDRFPA